MYIWIRGLWYFIDLIGSNLDVRDRVVFSFVVDCYQRVAMLNMNIWNERNRRYCSFL